MFGHASGDRFTVGMFTFLDVTSVSDPRDFLVLCRLGGAGLSAALLGLAGVMVQTDALRRAMCFALLVTGTLLMLDAASRFHRLEPSPARSLTFLTIAMTPLLIAIVRRVRRNDNTERQSDGLSDPSSR